MSERHQQAMYRKRTAWTIIRDSYEISAFQRISAYQHAYADGLLFALKALKARPLGKDRRLPRRTRGEGEK
jgi:hypothetical protein